MSRRSPWPARVGLTLVAVGAVSVVATPSQAATSGVVSVVRSTIVQYSTATGRANNVVLTRSANTITVDDTVAIKAGTGCLAVSGDSTKVRCTTKTAPTWLWVYLHDGNDSLVNNTGLGVTVDGGDGNDKITGGPRGDNLYGGAGADAIWGLAGNDQIRGDESNDAISGGDGEDWVEGGQGNDRMFGGSGDDQLLGMEGNDVEDAGPGNDTFAEDFDSLTPDADTFIGGSGNDLANYVARDKPIVADADGVKGDDGAAGEHDTIGTDVEGIQGGDGNDRLIGTSRPDILYGGRGNDVIAGGAGDDILLGQGGRDYLNGAGGDDILVGDDSMFGGPAADTLLGGTGRDRVDYSERTTALTIDLDGSAGDDGQAGEKDTVGADVEDVEGGAGNDRITGNAAANTLAGNAGNDALFGLDGHDTLTGSDGADTISGGAGDDSLDAVDGRADRVDGGAANDICQIDDSDTIANCERNQP